MDTITWIWLIVGILLMVSEILVPGLVVIFLGLAAVIVAGGRWIGLIDGLVDSFTYWFILSTFLCLGMRGLVSKITPGEIAIESGDDDEAAIGREVEVLEETCSDNDNGRIRFRGTTWKAMTEFGRIYPGQKARIYSRKDMIWIVDPIDESVEKPQLESKPEEVKEKSIVEKKKSRRFFIRKKK